VAFAPRLFARARLALRPAGTSVEPFRTILDAE
jgi:hypothetical protein